MAEVDYSPYVKAGLSGAQSSIANNANPAYPAYQGWNKANPYAQQTAAQGMQSSGYDPTKGTYAGIGRVANSPSRTTDVGSSNFM